MPADRVATCADQLGEGCFVGERFVVPEAELLINVCDRAHEESGDPSLGPLALLRPDDSLLHSSQGSAGDSRPECPSTLRRERSGSAGMA